MRHLLLFLNLVSFISAFTSVLRSSTSYSRLQVISHHETRSISNLEVQHFSTILLDEKIRKSYQIIDVREVEEIKKSRLPYSDIIYLPFSDVSDWSEDVKSGQLLDPLKPTLCISRSGARSMKVANFLASVVGFDKVYNLKGGFNKYQEICVFQ